MSYGIMDAAPPPTLEQFPAIDSAAVTRQINRFFTPYVFFEKHRGSIELWTSCCMKHGSMSTPPRTVTTVEYELLYNKHNEYVTCPYCGARAKYKNAKKLGKKKNLEEYKPVVLLSEKDGDIYARAYWSRKKYTVLDEAPKFYLVGAYHFTPGRATWYFEPEYSSKAQSISGNYDPVHRVVTEPFTEGSGFWWRYVPYVVLGTEAIKKSAFRYCGYEEFEHGIDAEWGLETVQTRSEMMKYLAAASIYPRQIEMLQKTGFEDIVFDLVCGRKKKKEIFDWSKSNYLDAFGLTKVEMREWRESDAGMDVIKWYKRLRRAGVPESFENLKYLLPHLVCINEQDFFRICCRQKIKPTKLGGYLSEGGIVIPEENFRIYKDYIEMAGQLGWDLDNETVKLPKNLHRRHDEAIAEINAKALWDGLETIGAKLARRMMKYNFEMGDYFIRCAVSTTEIISEGKALQHCVGGYAQRHMEGKLTILFLRRKDEPNKSLYTIEMHGNTLIQIHGYQNDRGTSAPIITMAWMLDPWLDWISKGSKRDDEGRPKLPKKKEAKTA